MRLWRKSSREVLYFLSIIDITEGENKGNIEKELCEDLASKLVIKGAREHLDLHPFLFLNWLRDGE